MFVTLTKSQSNFAYYNPSQGVLGMTFYGKFNSYSYFNFVTL